MPLKPGDRFGGRFEIVGELGRGGMATVYLARSGADEVALKVVHAHLADRPSMARRLGRELRASQAIEHPAVVPATELCEDDGQLALVMPVYRGPTLQELVDRNGALNADDLAMVLTRIGGALATAHAAGVVHGDVTPSNVLVDGGSAFLVDFGLARMADGQTASTTAFGTAGYAAPEVWRGVRDPRSDAFSLGAVLFFAATGRPPFDAPTAAAALQLQLAGEPPSLATLRPDLPTPLVAAIEGLLAPKMAGRPPLSEATALAVTRSPPPRPARRTPQWTQVGSAASLACMVGIGWFQDLGSFLITTIYQGHAIPDAEMFEVTAGISLLLLLPLGLVPAVVGATVGAWTDTTRRLAPWAGIAGLAMTNLLYAAFVAMGMAGSGSADLFGSMVFHQGLFFVVVVVATLATRPWRDLRADAAPVAEVEPTVDPLVARAAAALDLLEAAAKKKGVPTPIRSDLAALVAQLRDHVASLGDELSSLVAGRAALALEPTELARLEAQLARARTLGDVAAAELGEAVAAREAVMAEVDALDGRITRTTARLLETCAVASRARATLLDAERPEAVTRALGELRRGAEAARAAIAEVQHG